MRQRRLLRSVGTVLLGIGLVAAVFAAWLFVDLIRRADERIEKGGTVEAEVSAVRHRGYGIWGGQEIEVHYQVAGKSYVAGLMPVWSVKRDDIPQTIRLYVDPADPSKVSTSDSYISEGMLTTVPSTIFAFAVLFIIFGVHFRIVSRKPKLRLIEGADDNGLKVYVQVDFPVVWRGYDRKQVNNLMVLAVSALESAEGDRRHRASRVLAHPALMVKMFGYERQAVDQFLRQAQSELAEG